MTLESPLNLVYEWLDRLNLDGLLTRLMGYFQTRSNQKKSRFLLIDDVLPMLQALYEKYPLAIVSARDEHNVYAFLRQYKLLKYL